MEGKWPQQDGIYHAKDSDICANAQPENKNRDDRECTILSQCSKSEAQVLSKDIHPRQPSRLAMLLLRLLYSAKTNHRSPPCFVRIHTSTHVLFNGHLQMRSHLR